MNRDPDPSNGEAFDAALVERDRTLIAVRDVEHALSRAAGVEDWVDHLKSSLESLQEAMSEEQRELNRPGSLLTMISAERPRRLGPRVRGIREQYDDIARQLISFRRELDDWDGSVAEIGDVRHRLAWILRALHNCRSRQADLVFEALGLDLGERRDG
ncbi:MAG TPA: hypothetical protein VHL52_11315 [Acidimicrobiia bacterium]|nr:hypothetical protein [Acidimicrobiia bacterium]